MGFDRIIDFIIESLSLFQFYTVIDTYETGVILRFGKYHRTIGAGFHFIIPFYVENIMVHDTVLTTRNLGVQTLTTSDDVGIVVSSIVTYIVTDVKKLLLEVESAETVLEDTIYRTITDKISNSEYDNIRKVGFTDNIKKEIYSEIANFGIDIKNIAFMDLAEIKTIRLMTESNTMVLDLGEED